MKEEKFYCDKCKHEGKYLIQVTPNPWATTRGLERHFCDRMCLIQFYQDHPEENKTMG